MSNNIANSRIAINSIFLTIRMVLVMAIGLYSTRVVLGVIGVSDYGIYNVVGSFVSMFAFINTSMSNGIQRFYNFELGKNKEPSLSHVFSVAIRVQLCLSVIVIFLTETIGLWYLYEKMVIPDGRYEAAFWCFQFSVITLVLNVLQLPFAALVMAHEKMNFYALLSILDALLKLIIAIALPSMGGDRLIVYGILLLFITIINTGIYVVYTQAKFPNDIKLIKGEKELYKKMLFFSGWNFFGSFGGVVRDQGLNMLLNLFFGTIVNAARGVAYQVMGACQSFVGNITTASRPQLTQSYAEGNIERSLNIMYSMSKLCFISLLFFALPVILEIDSLLQIWLGDNIPEYTSLFVMLIMTETMIDVLNPPISFMVHATGNMRKYQVINTFVSFLSLPIAYILLSMGIGAYIVFVVAIVFSFVRQTTSIFILRTLISFEIKSYIKSVIFPMLIVVILSFALPYILHTILSPGWLRIIIVGIISGMCVCGFSFVFGLNISEKNIVKQFIKRIKVLL